jgi:acetolactate synthase I/III small subunit
MSNQANANERFTFSALAENVPGVLQRLSIIFTRRKINIESMTASAAGEGLSRITFVVRSQPAEVSKVLGQMKKVIELKEASAWADNELLFREMFLCKVLAKDAVEANAVEGAVRSKGGRVIGPASGELLVEFCGSECEVDAFLKGLTPYEVKDFIRSGRVALIK